ncbi:MAG: hypothetical protein SFY66_06370, partial [Oculatellaceae cyanobacterium bins.114]|nr:hypothetical protein [Oculatellaceae cyanobacterium bins.114]
MGQKLELSFSGEVSNPIPVKVMRILEEISQDLLTDRIKARYIGQASEVSQAKAREPRTPEPRQDNSLKARIALIIR